MTGEGLPEVVPEPVPADRGALAGGMAACTGPGFAPLLPWPEEGGS